MKDGACFSSASSQQCCVKCAHVMHIVNRSADLVRMREAGIIQSAVFRNTPMWFTDMAAKQSQLTVCRMCEGANTLAASA